MVLERAELDQTVLDLAAPARGELFQKVPDQGVPVREELRRGTLGLQELRRVVLVQEEREKPGQVGLAEEKGKVAHLLGVVAGEEWKVIVARALASMLDLQLQ